MMLKFLMHALLTVATSVPGEMKEPANQEPDSVAQDDLRQDLQLPENSLGSPGPGKRVAVISPEFQGTNVHHMLYLPPGWKTPKLSPDERYPVIVEFTGNYFPKAGSTGRVEDAGLGYGISRGKFIWITLPFVSKDGMQNAIRWWGDERATVDYATTNIPRICDEFGGDRKAVFICGFSRGAIATNYIGLYNDRIAQLWCGFITHDHYDGVLEWKGTSWGSPLAQYRRGATTRLRRLNGRPCLISQAGGAHLIAEYLRPIIPLSSFTFVDVDPGQIFGRFPNKIAIHPHTDRWLLKDSTARRAVWNWLKKAVDQASLKTP